jgi:2',3'-cyclic-nucleotide 2'-phosphodiesterase (5'-nucleotidase family)
MLAEAWRASAGAEVGLEPESAQFESFRAHEVTRYQVHAIVPFHDVVWRGEISGARLKAVLAASTKHNGAMHATIAAADVDPAKTYTVASTDFVGLALGGGANTGIDARKAVETWLAPGR